jgi:hypothetical protein
VVEELEQKL